MPVLPHVDGRSIGIAADLRIINSRQLRRATEIAAHQALSHAKQLIRRIPRLLPRQTYNAQDVCNDGYVSGCYRGENAGPTPGAVVGIVLGSVAGFLILLALLYILSQSGGFMRTSRYQEEVVDVRRRSRSPRSRRSHRSSYREEMRTRSPRRNQIIREERVVRDRPPQVRETSRLRETVTRETRLVDEERIPERRVEGDDVVEVIEEHSDLNIPPPRRQSRRSSGYRSVDPASHTASSPADPIRGGYRNVDPDLFAGGDFPQHEI